MSCFDFDELGEAEAKAAVPAGGYTGAALPVMPRPAAATTAPMSPQDFAAELQNILSSLDGQALGIPEPTWDLSSGAEGDGLRELCERAVSSDKDVLPRFMSILARRAVGRLAIFQEKVQKEPKEAWGHDMRILRDLHAAISLIGLSLSDDIAFFPPKATFSGNVVFVLGYGGGSLADLMDCPPAYQAMDPGCLVVNVVYHAGTPSGAGQLAMALEEAVNAWADADGSVKPNLFVHLFSNLGMSTWLALMRLWDAQVLAPDTARLRGPVPEMSSVLKGLVLDSCPDQTIIRGFSVESFVQSHCAVFAACNGWDENGNEMSQRDAMKEALRAKMEVMKQGSLWRLWYDAKWSDDDIRKYSAVDCTYLHEKEPPVPRLFIYSESDNIISAGGVEAYISELTQRARPPPEPLRRKLQKSPHCLHKKGDAEAYWKAVLGLWKAVDLPVS